MALHFKNKITFNQLLIALIVFIISKLVLFFVLIDIDLIYVHLDCWVRGDSAHYLDIASKGYEYFPCAGHFGYPLDAKEICGNTGWFPGYSILVRGISFVTNNVVLSAVIITNVFYYLSLFFVLKITNKSSFSIATIAYLCLGAFFFGFIYYHAVFPIAMVVFFSLFSIYYFSKNNILLSAIGCMIVAFTYPSGFLLPISLALTLLITQKSNYKSAFLKSLLILIVGAGGMLLCFLLFHLQFNDWQAFFKVQAKYQHELRNPLENIYNHMKEFDSELIVRKNAIVAQSFFVIIGYLCITLYFWMEKKHKNQIDLAVFLHVTLFLVFPWLVGGELSMYRSEALLLPGIILIKDAKTDYITSILSVFLFIGIPMSILFFKNGLI